MKVINKSKLALSGLTLCFLLHKTLGTLRIEPDKDQVRESESFMFTCTVTGESGDILHFKYGTVSACSYQLSTNQVIRNLQGVTCGHHSQNTDRYYLMIEPVLRSQNSDKWHCQVGSNNSNFATLDVKYSSNVTSFTGNYQTGTVTVNENAGVTLQCRVDANPRGSVAIRRDNYVLSRTDNGIMTQGNVTSAQCRDAGTYTCDAKNDIGASSSVIKVLVKCAPLPVNPIRRPVYVVIHGQITLELLVFAYPTPVFTWYHPSGEIIQVSNGTVISESTVKDSHVIQVVSQIDFGDYVVNVDNEQGSVNLTLTLKEEEGLSGGMLVGVVAGCVVLGIFILLFICVIVRKVSRKQKDSEFEESEIRLNTEKENCRPVDIYSEVTKTKKQADGEITSSGEEQGLKTGRDEDGLMYIGVEVDVSDQSRIIKDEVAEVDVVNERTQYAEVDVHNTAVRYRD